MAYAVAGDSWAGLGWSLVTVLLQATFYRLLGALMYILIGHHEVLMFVALRTALVAGYVVAGILFPLSSHLVVSSQLLNGSPALAPLQNFLIIYGVLCLLSGAALYGLLVRQRRLTASPPGTAQATAATVPAAQPEEVTHR
jgi:hypothetical protein